MNELTKKRIDKRRRYTQLIANEYSTTADQLKPLRDMLKQILNGYSATELAAAYNIGRDTLLNFAYSPIRTYGVLYTGEDVIPNANTLRIVQLIIRDKMNEHPIAFSL